MDQTWPVIVLLLAAAFGVFLWVRLPRLAEVHTGRVLLLVALLIMPLALMGIGVTRSLDGSKQKEFCTSCHEMEVYDLSLQIDDPEYVPAHHYQNRMVPQDTACYTCHTDYTLYGDVSAKLNGLKHVWVHYFGDVPPPGEIALYNPYPNDNCLQCHRGARRFEKKASHNSDGVTLELLYSNQKSCVSSGCHDKIHDIKNIAKADLWGEARWPIPSILLERAKESPGAEDPFAEDPFADEPSPDAGSTGSPDASDEKKGERPASEIDNVDELWDDDEDDKGADAGPTPASDASPGADSDAAAPAPSPDAVSPTPAGGDAGGER